MKPFAIALFVINLLALGYAWYATYLATPDRQPPRAELQPERIRLMSAAEATALAVKARQRACMEWGAFASADTGRAQKVLEAEGIRFTERRVEGGSRWWVHVPTLPTKRQADQRAQEIRKLGLTEDPVVQDDHGRHGFGL